MTFLFGSGVLPPPRSQGALLWVRAATSGRCLSCARVPQQRWSLSAVNLHPPRRVSFSAEVAAAFTDAFFCAAALLDFQDWQSAVQRSHFLSRLPRSSFQVKRCMQRVQDQQQMPAGQKQFHQGLLVVLECTGEQHTSPQSS